MKRSAIISTCGRYRYELRREWDAQRPWVLFIGLNPSTADAEKDDNTSKVCINYAKRWGYGGMVLANLFAYRSTDSGLLYRVLDPVGPYNDRHLRRLLRAAAETICVWSDLGTLHNRAARVLPWITAPKCLCQLESGQPGHPLYKPRNLKPKRLKPVRL